MNTKRCPTCKLTKPRSEFNKCRSRADGLQAYCRSCTRKIAAEFRARHIDAERERDRIKNRLWTKNNPEKNAAKEARRRALRLKQTPSWCAPGTVAYDAIGDLYSDAIHFGEVFGVEYHLDHKLPLARGGSHEPDNLHIIPAEWNLSKGAKIDWTPPPNVFHKVTWRSWSRQRAR